MNLTDSPAYKVSTARRILDDVIPDGPFLWLLTVMVEEVGRLRGPQAALDAAQNVSDNLWNRRHLMALRLAALFSSDPDEEHFHPAKVDSASLVKAARLLTDLAERRARK